MLPRLLSGVIAFLLSFLGLIAQPMRLVIMQGHEANTPTIAATRTVLEGDMAFAFGITDIIVIRPATGNEDSDYTYTKLEEGMELLSSASCIQGPGKVIIGFLFPLDDGPDVTQVHEAIRECDNPPKLLSNKFFKDNLSELHCGPYPILEYSRGIVKREDEITEKRKIPVWAWVIPPVLGGTTYLLLSGNDEDTPCTPVDASWTVPEGICMNDAPVQLNPDGTSGGTWSGTGVSVNGLFDPSAGTQQISYSVGEGECRRTMILTISVGSADAGWQGPNTVCVGETAILQPNQNGGTWTGDGLTVNPDGTASFTHEQEGEYPIQYSITVSACSDQVEMTITVVPDADASWTVPEGLCTGEVIELAPEGTQGGQWSGTGVTDLGNGTATFSVGEPASYQVTYTVGAGECQSLLSQELLVESAPDASWTIPDPVCVGETITLSPSGDQGGTWSGQGITDLGDGTAEFSSPQAGAYEITYSITTGNCTSEESQTIEVIDSADPSWTIPTDLCSGSEVTLVPDGTQGGTWSGQAVTDLGNGSASFAPPSEGKYIVTYSVGQGGCADSMSQTIQVIQTPDASWTPPGSAICTGESITLIPDGTTGGVWTGDGVTDNGDGTATFSSKDAGEYIITYTATNGPCTSATTDTIHVIDSADPAWTSPGETCTGDVIDLVPGATPGGTWTGDGVTDNGDGTAVFSQEIPGAYAVTYTVGQGACAASQTDTIYVLQGGDPSWTPPGTTICPGTSYELSAPAGNWSGENVTNIGDGQGEFFTTEPGTYQVTLTVGEGICEASETHDIEVADNTVPEITTPAQDLIVECDGTGNAEDIQAWLDGNGGASAMDNCPGTLAWDNDFFGVPFDCGMSGNATVTFTVTDLNGNTATTFATVFIEDNQPPEFSGIPPDITVQCDNIPLPPNVTAIDQCSGVTPVEYSESTSGLCPQEILRSWTATDDCGNTISINQTILVVDDTPPEATFVPPDIEIECPEPPETCIPPIEQAEFADNCDSDPVVEFFEEFMELSPTELLIIRCWTAFDNCGNASQTVCQNIFIFQMGTLQDPLSGQGSISFQFGFPFDHQPGLLASNTQIVEQHHWQDWGFDPDILVSDPAKIAPWNGRMFTVIIHNAFSKRLALWYSGSIGLYKQVYKIHSDNRNSSIIQDLEILESGTGLRIMPIAELPLSLSAGGSLSYGRSVWRFANTATPGTSASEAYTHLKILPRLKATWEIGLPDQGSAIVNLEWIRKAGVHVHLAIHFDSGPAKHANPPPR